MSGLHSHPLPVGDSEPADVQESQHFKGEDFQIEVGCTIFCARCVCHLVTCQRPCTTACYIHTHTRILALRPRPPSAQVSQAPGYLCHIKATAVFRLPPDVLFRQVIVHPDNAELFRHMDRCGGLRSLGCGC